MGNIDDCTTECAISLWGLLKGFTIHELQIDLWKKAVIISTKCVQVSTWISGVLCEWPLSRTRAKKPAILNNKEEYLLTCMNHNFRKYQLFKKRLSWWQIWYDFHFDFFVVYVGLFV